MQNTSDRLLKNITNILTVWELRTLEEIKAANLQETLALRDSLPEYLKQLAGSLSKTIDRTEARKRYDKAEATRVGKKHGEVRAGSIDYTMDQMILEYHILRQVICDILEEEAPLTTIEREVIVCSVEQAVNDAATQFSDTLKELQDHMTHTLAHDLRNPLASAKISAQLIMSKPDKVSICLESSKRIERSIDRIDKMISELLDASRLKAGESSSLEFRELDIDWLVRDVAYELNIGRENRVMVDSPGENFGFWNESGLRRMLENLVTNAFKYGRDHSPIKISIMPENKAVTVCVHNEGEPIESNEMSVLFEKFKRARSAEDKVGWGLGLSVVKSMVDAHAGSIAVESEIEKGTSFIIKLPRNPPEILNA